MRQWAQTKPADVVFLQTPAALNPVWEQNARGFYAAQLMGYQNKTHQAMFDAIQKDRQKLFDQASLGKWYAAQGLDINKFNNLYNSFAVNTRIARSVDAAQRYQLTGVPAVVVDGKYVVSGEDGRVPQVVDYLVKKPVPNAQRLNRPDFYHLTFYKSQSSGLANIAKPLLFGRIKFGVSNHVWQTMLC